MALTKTTLWDRLRDGLRDWSILKQLAGEDPQSTAAQSRQSRALRPRTEEADRVGTSICPYCAVGCEVDEAETLLVRFRDSVIAELRAQGSAPAAAQQRTALTRLNTALSLLVGVEYPTAGIQRSAIGQARDILQQILAEGLLT